MDDIEKLKAELQRSREAQLRLTGEILTLKSLMTDVSVDGLCRSQIMALILRRLPDELKQAVLGDIRGHLSQTTETPNQKQADSLKRTLEEMQQFLDVPFGDAGELH